MWCWFELGKCSQTLRCQSLNGGCHSLGESVAWELEQLMIAVATLSIAETVLRETYSYSLSDYILMRSDPEIAPECCKLLRL